MILKSTLTVGLIGLAAWLVQEPAASPAPVQEPAAAVSLDGIKCVVMGEKGSASADFATAWRDGTVYLCCNQCKTAFEKDPSAFALQANHQLVLTGQYEQKLCPVSGHELAADARGSVGGAEIGYCCADCKAKVEGVSDATEQAKLVFSDEVFEKCFAKKPAAVSLAGLKCFLMPKKDVNPEKFVEFNGGRVYVCCDGCLKRLAKDPSKFAAQANQQLVQTGQYRQTGCPLGGGDVAADQSIEVLGVKIGFCCANCKAKAEAAEGKEQVELLFGADAFARGFSKN